MSVIIYFFGHFMTIKDGVSPKKLEKIFWIICALQMKSPLEPIRKIQVKKALARRTIIGDPFTSKKYSSSASYYALDKLMTRAFHILVHDKKIKNYPKDSSQYWLPKCLKDYKEYEKRKKDFLQQILIKDKEIAEKDKELAQKNDDMAFAKTFLHAIKFCRTDEDWELLNVFYRKMRDNEKAHIENMEKYLKENQEAWEEQQKFYAEITKEHPIPEKAEIPKNVKITEPEKLKPIEKTPWDE